MLPCLLLTTAGIACGDDGSPGPAASTEGGTDTDDSTDSASASDSDSASASDSDSASASDSDSDSASASDSASDSDSDSATSTGTTNGPSTDTETGPTTDTDSGSTGTGTGTDTDTDTATGTTGGDQAGFCAQGCEEAADCCPLGAIDCPGENYPNNWMCTDGICEFGGCANNDDCNTIIETQECHPIDEVGTCFEPCANDNDCLQGTCTGMSDDGENFCQVEPEPCEDDADCGGLGICDVDSGTCFCQSDANCTDDTFNTCSM